MFSFTAKALNSLHLVAHSIEEKETSKETTTKQCKYHEEKAEGLTETL